jgi:hypothetical protein
MPPMAGLGGLLLDGPPPHPPPGSQPAAASTQKKESRVGREFQAVIPAVGESAVNGGGGRGANARESGRLVWSAR